MRNALLALTSVALLLGTLELATRMFGPGEAGPVAGYIANWERQWGDDFYTLKPGRGVNSEGLRDVEYEARQISELPRIAFLGDSVIFGFKLAPELSVPALLRQLLEERGQPSEVMNVALPGWSTRQQRIAYRRIVQRYEPDQVFLGFCLNDVAELQNNLERPPPLLLKLYRHSALFRTLLRPQAREIARVEELFLEPRAAHVRKAWNRTFAELDALVDEVRTDGAGFGLVVLPFRFQLRANSPAAPPQERLHSWAEGRDVPFLDALPALHRAGWDAFLDYDHLSAKGARTVAQAIASSDLLGAPGFPRGKP